MRVAVTGAGGFVGRNLLGVLREAGHQVLAVDLISDPAEHIQPADVRDPSVAADLVHLSEAVIHLAALPGVATEDPHEAFSANVEAAHSVIEEAPAILVLASSLAARWPTSSRYAAAKLWAECHARSVAGIDVRVLRFANLYGPHSLHKRSAVHAWIRAGLAGRPLEVTPPGSQERDFTWVGDACRAIAEALERPSSGPWGGHDVGTGQTLTVLEVASLVAAETGGRVVMADAEPEQDPADLLGEEAEPDRGAFPGLPWALSIEEGIRRTVDWYREVLHGEAKA